jgi:hypothetical protein
MILDSPIGLAAPDPLVCAGVCWGLEEFPDAARDVAFEAAQRFASAFALLLFAGEVRGGVGVQAAFGDGEAVQRS